MRSSRTEPSPVYRCIRKDSRSHPTCVVAGRDRRTAWLYVHGATPMVLRLHPPVVRFLRDVLAEVAGLPARPVVELGPLYRHLPRHSELSHPDCVVAGRSRRDTWLHVFAATPSAVRLVPRLVDFLGDALADLPATSAASAEAGSAGPQPLSLPYSVR